MPGDIVETGVLKGGSVVLMRACLRALEMEGEGRRVIACDTFRKQKPPPPLLVQWALFPVGLTCPETCVLCSHTHTQRSPPLTSLACLFPDCACICKHSQPLVAPLVLHAGTTHPGYE